MNELIREKFQREMKEKYFPDDLVAKDDEELKEEFKYYISKATSLALVEKSYIE
jgi:hypothetical protein